MSLKNLENVVIDERILRALSEMGFEAFTPIQEQAIPSVMAGLDVIGQAQTGTGKTAAFGVPILQMVDPEDDSLQAIILCPTRELAIQAAEELRKFSKYMHGIRVLPVYGGQDILKQIRSLKGGVQIVVGTPGRVMDHLRRHTLKPDHVKMVVLDEADEMLAMGFREDMETILEQIEAEHQTMLFSATMPQPILDITGQFQKDPVLIKTVVKELTVPSIKQYYYEVRRENKKEATSRILDYYNPKRTLIFCNTKRMVEELAEELKGRGYFAEGLHGDLSQAMRDRIMASFRGGTCDVLIATDVAARGIDIGEVEAVINYDVPQEIEYYVHRIGRTGRAGREGRSFTFVVGREIYKIRDIERVCKTTMTARAVPTSSDINQSKAGKVLEQAIEVIRAGETDESSLRSLDPMVAFITEQMEKADVTALELAAALLRVQVGEDREDIPLIDYIEEKRKRRELENSFLVRRAGESRGRRDGEGRGRRDGEGRGRRDGEDRGRRDGEGRGRRGRFDLFEENVRGNRQERRAGFAQKGDSMEIPFKKFRNDLPEVELFFNKKDKKRDEKASDKKDRKHEDKHSDKKSGKHAEKAFEKKGNKHDKPYDKKGKRHEDKKRASEDIASKIKKLGKPKKLDRKGNPIY